MKPGNASLTGWRAAFAAEEVNKGWGRIFSSLPGEFLLTPPVRNGIMAKFVIGPLVDGRVRPWLAVARGDREFMSQAKIDPLPIMSWEPHLVRLVMDCADVSLCSNEHGNRSRGTVLGASVTKHVLGACQRFIELFVVHRSENLSEVHSHLQELLDCTGQCNRLGGYVSAWLNSVALELLDTVCDTVWNHGISEEPIPAVARRLYENLVTLRVEAEHLEEDINRFGRALAREACLSSADEQLIRTQWQNTLKRIKALETTLEQVASYANGMQQLIQANWENERAVIRRTKTCWPPVAPSPGAQAKPSPP